MSNEEYFPDVEETNVNNFKENVYIKPKQDMKMYVGKNFQITHAVETRSLFEPGCSSWDRVKGYRRETKEEVLCAECPYAKGIPQGEGKLPLKCQLKYAIFMAHESEDKQYVLSVSVPVYRDFAEYRKSLLKIGLDVNKVITKITREEPLKGNGYAYAFEFVSELDLNATTDEENTLLRIKKHIDTLPEKSMSVLDVADIIVTFFETEGKEMTENRARRLANSISADGISVKV